MPVDPLPPHRRTAARARDQAIRRVSHLTVATVFAGATASIGFAGLAAMTYAGTSSPAGNPATTDTTITQQRVDTSQPQSATVPEPIQVVQPPLRSSGRARVTAGGSG
jgi:hypothetical protein